MAQLSLRLLGQFQVQIDDKPVVGFKTDKARALLAYLAVEAGQPHQRVHLAGLLWPAWPEAIAVTDDHEAEAEVYRLQGAARLLHNPPLVQEAEAAFRQAIAIVRRQAARSLELRATVSLSRLLQSQERGTEALALLSAIYDWFTEGFDTPDLQEATALKAYLMR